MRNLFFKSQMLSLDLVPFLTFSVNQIADYLDFLFVCEPQTFTFDDGHIFQPLISSHINCHTDNMVRVRVWGSCDSPDSGWPSVVVCCMRQLTS